MGADVHEPGLDLGPAEAVGRLGLGEERGALLVGSEHHFDEALGTRRRFLGHGADARLPWEGHLTAFGRELAEQNAKEGGFPVPLRPTSPTRAPVGTVKEAPSKSSRSPIR
jgi:hypothetical protein